MRNFNWSWSLIGLFISLRYLLRIDAVDEARNIGGNRFPYYTYPAIQTSSGRKLEIPMTNAFTSAVMQYANIDYKANISYQSV